MMATTYRFEINKGKANTGRALELARIEQHEQDQQSVLDKKRAALESFKIDWKNNFDEVNKMFAKRNKQKSNCDELKILRRANLMVSWRIAFKYFSIEYFNAHTLLF